MTLTRGTRGGWFDADRLARDLRAYAAREHGKRAELHFEISSQVFAFADDLAAIIEAQRKRQLDAIEGMAKEAQRLGLDD